MWTNVQGIRPAIEGILSKLIEGGEMSTRVETAELQEINDEHT
jgi:hypothetical protein